MGAFLVYVAAQTAAFALGWVMRGWRHPTVIIYGDQFADGRRGRFAPFAQDHT